MNKKELLDKMTEKNNGYLFVSEVEKENISRTYLAEYVHSNNFERVAKGIYISEDTWKDFKLTFEDRSILEELWNNYTCKNYYAGKVQYKEVVEAVKRITNMIIT